MIKGLDDDEIEYLDLVDRTKLAAEQRKNLDEERELNDYRNRVASLQEKCLDQRLQAEISVGKPKPAASQHKHSQQKLLKGVLIKKSETKKRKLSEEDSCQQHCPVNEDSNKRKHENPAEDNRVTEGAMTCIGILPGLGCYNDSSESEMSSESDLECQPVSLDLLGRKIIKKKQDEAN